MSSVNSSAVTEDAAPIDDITVICEDSETAKTVHTTLRFDPTFNFYAGNAILIRHSANGIHRASRLIRKDGSVLSATFTIHDDDWTIEGSRKVEFAIVHGYLADDAPSLEEFEPLRGKHTHTFETHIPLPSSHGEGSDIFYDASSQVKAEVAKEPSDASSDSDTSKDDDGLDIPTVVDLEPGPIEQDGRMDVPTVVVDSEIEHSDRDEPTPRDDSMTRLNRATRPIFNQQSQTDYDALSARLPARTTTMSAVVNTRSDVNIADDSDHDMDLLQVNTNPIIRGNVRKMSGTIGGHFSSGKSNSDDHEVTDVDSKVAELGSDIRPTFFTINGLTGKRSPSHTPGPIATERGMSKDALADGIGPDTEDSLPKKDTRTPLDIEKDLARKEKNKLRRAAGKTLKRELPNLAASNDDKLRSGHPPKSRNVSQHGTDEVVAATNVHILEIINKQVKLNLVLVNYPGASAAADIRRGLPKWKEDAIDDYDRQLGAAIESAESYKQANPKASARRSTVGKISPDFDVAFSQPDEMDMPGELDLQVRIPASYTGTKRGSEAFEEVDNDDLPDVGSIGPRTSRVTPLRNGEAKPAEPPAKKARGSMARLSFDS